MELSNTSQERAFCYLEQHAHGGHRIGDRTYLPRWISPISENIQESLRIIRLGVEQGNEVYQRTGRTPSRIDVLKNQGEILIAVYD